MMKVVGDSAGRMWREELERRQVVSKQFSLIVRAYNALYFSIKEEIEFLKVSFTSMSV